MLLGVILIILSLLVGVYFLYKGSKLMAAVMSLLAAVVFVSINGNEFTVAVPTLLILCCILLYKGIVKYGEKERIAEMKVKLIVSTVVLVIFQILMIGALFFKSR